ncbi:hypothetical protein [Paractinoplanes brasiliensis]|uniref:Uncharacterized protein n=1 Tax=Paractinoplanes brasiliensis TaxID=52695 RepID=A0A4R6K0L0_9ACTN|nr:hypothetical protein [Actinoplanes brasiliensis]TDO41782.1 hypothetical protein C8E87_5525 [Actinoplanes brasiliensis]GID29952.1 hypothetical protein Abr02nite_49350 [Actinoplanes brasiliensis]
MWVGAWRPRGLVALAGSLFLLAVGAAVAGIVLLRSAPSSTSTSFEIAKWLLQLGTVLAGTGFITAVLRQAEVTRAKREAWTTMLQDMAVGQDAVEGATMRLISDATAETYADLIEKCREMRTLLRRIMALPEAYQHQSELRRQIHRMRLYLKPLILEYERHYLRVVRQARLDGMIIEARYQEAAKDSRQRNLPTLPTPLAQPMGVGRLLSDGQEFPALAILRRDFNQDEIEFFPESEIDEAYENVKALLRKQIGLKGRRPVPSFDDSRGGRALPAQTP